MSGRGEPPESSRGGGPDGEDEFRVVFDESFVQAAVLHEPSAQERLRTGTGPRNLRRVSGMPVAAFRVGALMVAVVVVMAGALYLGGRRGGPAPRSSSGPAVLVRVSLVPAEGVVLAAVPPDADPFAGTPAAAWSDGRAGLTLPEQAATKHFSAPQIRESAEMVRDFIAGTQLNPDVWRGITPWASALRLARDQSAQLGSALSRPKDDDVSSATGWVTRFDPAVVAVNEIRARVHGVMAAAEPVDGELALTVDAVFVYAVKPPSGAVWTRFVVHRVWEFQIDRRGLRDGKMRVRRIVTVAAPQDCRPETALHFLPKFPLVIGGSPAQQASPEPPAAPAPVAPGGVRPAAVQTLLPAAAVPPEPSGPIGPGPLHIGGATGTTCGVLATAV